MLSAAIIIMLQPQNNWEDSIRIYKRFDTLVHNNVHSL